MATGWGQLGSALAGGGQLPAAMAEAQGEQLGANTQNAIAEAQSRAFKLKSLQNIGQATPALAGAEQDPAKLGAALALFAQAGVSPEQFTGAIAGNQKNNSYNTIVNPETPDDIVARHLVAEGKPGLIHEGAEGSFTNALHPDQTVQYTPLGQALGEGKLGVQKAQTENYGAEAAKNRALAANGGASPVKPPSGYQWAQNPDGTPAMDDNGQRKVSPLTGGNKDPNSPQPMGAVTSRYFQNSMNAGLQGATALANIMRQPGTATGGLFATVAQGHTPAQALISNFTTAVTPEEDNNLNTMLSGLTQNLATVDNSGRVANQAYVESMGRIASRKANTLGEQVIKLAEARQILENGLQSWEDTASLNNVQRAALQRNIATIKQAIPFTVQDVQAALAQAKPPAPTLADRARALVTPGNATPTSAPAAGGRSFATEQEAEAAGLQPGTRVVIGGVPGTWH